MKDFLKIAAVVLALGLAARGAWGVLTGALSGGMFAPADYTETVQTGGELEAAYLAAGPHQTEQLTVPAPREEWGSFTAWYPADLPQSDAQYPVVVMVNGTGVYASKYPAVFEHLASWGFIVVGNEDPSTCTGASADALLAWLLNENATPDSLLYGRVDAANIGLCGHSQGGVGVYNAVNEQPRGGLYRCAVSLSPTDRDLAEALNMPYDPAGTSIPVLLLAADSSDVIELDGMQRIFDALPGPKAMARRTGANHGQMLYTADGYVTAWLLWHLQGDEAAARAFTGAAPELASNPLYQDVRLAC